MHNSGECHSSDPSFFVVNWLDMFFNLQLLWTQTNGIIQHRFCQEMSALPLGQNMTRKKETIVP